jgi:hypothetical protein
MTNTKTAQVARKIEVAANIGIVIVALFAVTIFATRYLKKRSTPRQIQVGDQLGIRGGWKAGDKTLVFALSTTCHFCTESAGFYRQVVRRCAEKHIHTLAVFPQSVAQAGEYLKAEGVQVNEVVQAPLSELQIDGTPTLLLIDDKGIVKNVWLGKLHENAEEDVYLKLSLSRALSGDLQAAR